MGCRQATERLRACQGELEALGVTSASIFGSVARGEARPESDVDIAVLGSGDFSTGGFDSFWQIERLKERLSGVFGCRVDVAAEPARKERFQAEIDRDRALAF